MNIKKKYKIKSSLKVILLAILLVVLVMKVNIASTEKLEITQNSSLIEMYDSTDGNKVTSKPKTNKKSITLVLGEEKKLKALQLSFLKEDEIKWTSENEEIVSIKDNGIVKAISYGSTKVGGYIDDRIIEWDINVIQKNDFKPTKTVFVNNTGNDTTGNGTQSRPYATISKALSVINKNTTSISLKNGNNYELPRDVRGVYFIADKGDLVEITLSTSNDLTNCIFDNVSIIPNVENGIYNISDCTFKNNSYSSIFVKQDNIELNIKNSTFKDTKPNESEWIENKNWVRFWRYNPVNIYGKSVNLVVENSTFSDIMSRNVIYFASNYGDSNIKITNNVFTRTEGHVINFESNASGVIKDNQFTFVGELRNSIGNTDSGFGVGGNAIFSDNTKVPYNDIDILNNSIAYVMENGIEGNYKEIAYNYIKETGYRLKEGYYNPSTEGIWGGAKNGIHHNTVINPKLSGIRLENYGNAGLNYVKCEDNILVALERGEEGFNQSGVSIVVKHPEDKNVVVRRNRIEGFPKATRIDNLGYTLVGFDVQNKSENPLEDSYVTSQTDKK